MDDVQASVLQEFMAITGVEDPTAATNVLDATNWVLEEAVNLQFATGGELGAAGPAGAGGTGHGAADDIPPHLQEDEEVRAPLPAVVDRLYGDALGPHGVPPRVARYGTPPDRGPTHVDVFKDFGPAAGAVAVAKSSAAAGGSSAQAAAGAGAAASAPKLSDLFKPPAGLVFAGDWEAAVGLAGKQGKWLLLNVQSADEFATHRLNRDTWGDGLVQEMIKGTFVFWQVYSTADQGQALMHQYHLQQLPACVIVDPITRAKLWERYGFISAEGLVEELVPYLDCGPNDPGASDLAQRAFHQAAKRRHKEAAQPGSTGAAADAMVGMSDEEQLALALAMSVEQQPPAAAAGGAGPAAGDESDDDMDDLDEEAIWQEVQRRQREEDAMKAAAAAGGATPAPAPSITTTAAAAQRTDPASTAVPSAVVDIAAVQAAAAARLPAEPAEGAAGACRVAFRLPDGKREQRRFNVSDTVAALQDFCISVSAEAAGMSSFQLSEARPGAQPLTDLSATVAAAGVANAMLVLRPAS